MLPEPVMLPPQRPDFVLKLESFLLPCPLLLTMPHQTSLEAPESPPTELHFRLPEKAALTGQRSERSSERFYALAMLACLPQWGSSSRHDDRSEMSTIEVSRWSDAPWRRSRRSWRWSRVTLTPKTQ
jgi:hypothetical protein